jgi:long-chain acyl-CoA synthetase
MKKVWLRHYPAGVPSELRTDLYRSLVALMDEGVRQHRKLPAYRFMGARYSFEQIDQCALALAGYLLGLGLQRGDRVALMMPNMPQFAVAVAAVLRAGLVLVNLNPQHAPRELAHQLKDAGARAIVVADSSAAALQQVIDDVPTRHVILASMADMLGGVKRVLVNHLLWGAKRVPPFQLAGAVRFNDAVAQGRGQPLVPARVGPGDIAMLQYSSGTTGPSRAAVLLHRNLVANVLQVEAWLQPALKRVPRGQQPSMLCALPLHDVFGFVTSVLLGSHIGACSTLVPEPLDNGALLKALAGQEFHLVAATSGMYDAIVQHPAFAHVDGRHMGLCVAGGSALRPATARLWLESTGQMLHESYGLSEAGPMASCLPVDGADVGTGIGLPLPNTELALFDDAGDEVGAGMTGEIAIRGPQVMAGYWQRPDETARAMTADGFLRTGDIGEVDEQGRFRIVDRKKDTIVVGGFNVYPNEIEALVGSLAGVLECAAVAEPDADSGEAVKLLVVRSDASLSEADIRRHCEANLAGYKRPRRIEFRAQLPHSPCGAVLRRELREARA